MYTEHMTQALAVAGTPIHAQQLTATTTLTTGKVDMSLVHRCLSFSTSARSAGPARPARPC